MSFTMSLTPELDTCKFNISSFLACRRQSGCIDRGGSVFLVAAPRKGITVTELLDRNCIKLMWDR